MNYPKIAIVGRPNVGKSALFNRICGQRIAIVDEAEGITRDRLYAEAEFFGTRIQIIDTGGINARSKALFNEEVKRQAEIAIEEADGLVLVVDGQIGMTDLDLEVARILQKKKKPIALAVNKADDRKHDAMVAQFYSLGIGHMVAVSATQGRNLAELLEPVIAQLPHDEQVEGDDRARVAIIGRPNVGKSTLVNQLIGDDRCIVSPIAGTTRDSIDIAFTIEDRPYTIIDTAGIRKKRAEKEVVDKFAAVRTERALDRADVCILVVDAQQGITSYEKGIASDIEDAGKGCVILFNKWDLVKGFRMEHALKEVRDSNHFLAHCPIIFGSALAGRNLDKVLQAVDQVYIQGKTKFSTAELNKFMERTLQLLHPPMIQGKRLRIYYMTQVGNQPLRFLLFVNYPNLMDNAYKRYLYNQFRKTFDCTGTPILFSLKGKRSQANKNASTPLGEPVGLVR